LNPQPGSTRRSFPISSESVFSLSSTRRLLRQFRDRARFASSRSPGDPCAPDTRPRQSGALAAGPAPAKLSRCLLASRRDAVETCLQVSEGRWGTCKHVSLE
jgi:hypothetical protein